MQTQDEIDKYWMLKALEEAELAAKKDEVPVGAVIILENKLIGRGHNQPISSSDPTCHAEIVALREAAAFLQNYRTIGSTLYVTLEPCIMCAGALLHARVSRIVFGACDPKTGSLVSRYSIGNDNALNHRFDIQGGILEDRCSFLLKDFFSKKRKKSAE